MTLITCRQPNRLDLFRHFCSLAASTPRNQTTVYFIPHAFVKLVCPTLQMPKRSPRPDFRAVRLVASQKKHLNFRWRRVARLLYTKVPAIIKTKLFFLKVKTNTFQSSQNGSASVPAVVAVAISSTFQQSNDTSVTSGSVVQHTRSL